MTLGGGLELCLGAGDVQAAAETYAGLVEVGVGLVPGGGGTMNLLWRALEGMPDGATVDTYASRHADLQEHRAGDGRDERRGGEDLRLLPARRTACQLRPRAAADRGEGDARSAWPRAGWHPPAPRAYVLPGESGIATLAMMVDTLVDGGPGERARREDRGQARRDPLRRRVRRGPRGHRGRDARARARGLRQPLRRAQEPGAHAVHAHEQQAAAELVPGAPAPYPGNRLPPISWYPANFNRSKPLWRGTRKTAEGGPSPTSHPAARRSSPFEECAHVRPSDALPVRGHPRPDRFRRAGEWERTEYGPRHDSCA